MIAANKCGNIWKGDIFQRSEITKSIVADLCDGVVDVLGQCSSDKSIFHGSVNLTTATTTLMCTNLPITFGRGKYHSFGHIFRFCVAKIVFRHRNPQLILNYLLLGRRGHKEQIIIFLFCERALDWCVVIYRHCTLLFHAASRCELPSIHNHVRGRIAEILFWHLNGNFVFQDNKIFHGSIEYEITFAVVSKIVALNRRIVIHGHLTNLVDTVSGCKGITFGHLMSHYPAKIVFIHLYGHFAVNDHRFGFCFENSVLVGQLCFGDVERFSIVDGIIRTATHTVPLNERVNSSS